MSRRMKELFGADPELEKGGVWFDYGAGVRIKLARAGGHNRKYLLAAEAKTKPYRRAFETRTIDPDVAERINAEVFAATIVVAWEGFTDDDGKVLDCTPANVVEELLSDKDFFADIQQRANDFANYKRQILETEAKN